MENKEKYNQLLLSMSTFYAFNKNVKTSEDLSTLLKKYISINSTDEQEEYMKIIWEYSDPEKDQEGEKITGLSQLEVIPKKLMLDLDNVGEQLDEIIIICTGETEKNIAFTVKETERIEKNSTCTANDNNNSEKIITSNISSTIFFEERIKNWCKIKNYHIPDFEPVIIKEESKVPGNEILEIVTKIRDKKKNSKDYSLWIDTHGGLRNMQFLMNAIIYLLKDEEIEPKEIYGIEANNNTKKGKIIAENEKYQIFTFMAGMNEFFNFGSAVRLKDYFNKIKQDYDYSDLLQCITGISEAIQLCNMTAFGEEVEILKGLIKKKEIKTSNSIIIIFIDRIYKEYEDLIKNNSCENQIRWCINKNFIQQALTLVEAKMPRVIVERGILTYTDGLSIKYYDSDKIMKLPLSAFEKKCNIPHWKDINNHIIDKISDGVIDSKNDFGNKLNNFVYIKLVKNISIKLCIETTASTNSLKINLEYFLLIYKYLKDQRNHSNHGNGENDIKTIINYIKILLKSYNSLENKENIAYTDIEINSIHKILELLQ
ncbi:hypothetical protein [uncultured Robinsoniella sp.]|uniref:hypothetical protein n=1 Tax=uncultured Robinsoniella sp. TaxID=904190 RepID=UPI00374E5654